MTYCVALTLASSLAEAIFSTASNTKSKPVCLLNFLNPHKYTFRVCACEACRAPSLIKFYNSKVKQERNNLNVSNKISQSQDCVT